MRDKSIDTTDEQLLERVRRGDTGALGLLYVRYSSRVYDFALHFSGDDTEAEDITHNVFCRLWEHRDIMTDVSSLKAYLFKMTRNEILSIFRHRQVERNYAQQKHEEDGGCEDDCSGKIAMDELIEMINLTIERMPELRRKIFMMSRYDELTYAEIAEKVGLSPRTVQYHIGRALAELRKVMGIMAMFM